jgi:hypothetical protein
LLPGSLAIIFIRDEHDMYTHIRSTPHTLGLGTCLVVSVINEKQLLKPIVFSLKSTECLQ